jgi:23S rRNA A1618 N6-methylase RlmF
LSCSGTGASCVFPLLGARQCGWEFVATDTDSKAVEVATRNVRRNQLDKRINVLAVAEGTALRGVTDALPGRHFAFCMCNPPFFERDERDDKFVDKNGALVNEGVGNGRRRNRKRPHSATVARNNELCAEGGEVAVVNQIIDDSVQLKRTIQYAFSFLVLFQFYEFQNLHVHDWEEVEPCAAQTETRANRRRFLFGHDLLSGKDAALGARLDFSR